MSHYAITPLELDDIVRLRKPHACGGTEWQIVRIGADIGLKCRTCGRRVLLTRREFEKRLASKPGTQKSDLRAKQVQQPGVQGE